ncbi:transposon TX1, partial [Tanacetum coccineum]
KSVRENEVCDREKLCERERESVRPRHGGNRWQYNGKQLGSNYIGEKRNSSASFMFFNLPEDWGLGNLWMIFKKYGTVFDMFMVRKRLHNGQKYGFVRFKHVNDVEELLGRLGKRGCMWRLTYRRNPEEEDKKFKEGTNSKTRRDKKRRKEVMGKTRCRLHKVSVIEEVRDITQLEIQNINSGNQMNRTEKEARNRKNKHDMVISDEEDDSNKGTKVSDTFDGEIVSSKEKSAGDSNYGHGEHNDNIFGPKICEGKNSNVMEKDIQNNCDVNYSADGAKCESSDGVEAQETTDELEINGLQVRRDKREVSPSSSVGSGGNTSKKKRKANIDEFAEANEVHPFRQGVGNEGTIGGRRLVGRRSTTQLIEVARRKGVEGIGEDIRSIQVS